MGCTSATMHRQGLPALQLDLQWLRDAIYTARIGRKIPQHLATSCLQQQKHHSALVPVSVLKDNHHNVRSIMLPAGQLYDQPCSRLYIPLALKQCLQHTLRSMANIKCIVYWFSFCLGGALTNVASLQHLSWLGWFCSLLLVQPLHGRSHYSQYN